MGVLGDIWAQAGRDYIGDQLHLDEDLGSPRIYLGIQRAPTADVDTSIYRIQSDGR
jgi:hypothetical protein